MALRVWEDVTHPGMPASARTSINLSQIKPPTLREACFLQARVTQRGPAPQRSWFPALFLSHGKRLTSVTEQPPPAKGPLMGDLVNILPTWAPSPPRAWLTRCWAPPTASTSVSCVGRNLNSDSQTWGNYLALNLQNCLDGGCSASGRPSAPAPAHTPGPCPRLPPFQPPLPSSRCTPRTLNT